MRTSLQHPRVKKCLPLFVENSVNSIDSIQHMEIAYTIPHGSSLLASVFMNQLGWPDRDPRQSLVRLIYLYSGKHPQVQTWEIIQTTRLLTNLILQIVRCLIVYIVRYILLTRVSKSSTLDRTDLIFQITSKPPNYIQLHDGLVTPRLPPYP
jgi:hypothetical protein